MEIRKALSRRDFLRTSAAVGLAAAVSPQSMAFAQGSETLRVGLVGCGKRGLGAAMDCCKSTKGVQLVAMADVFQDQLDSAVEKLKKRIAPMFKVTPETSFVGFDAYKKLIASDVDIVLLVTPPAFRPAQFEACVEAGKHVFMEKPVATDPVGARSMLASAEKAKEKGLCVVAGTQRRHQASYIEIMKRIHDGQIGDIVAAQVYWMDNYSYYPPVEKKDEWSDMEWQLRNWNYFTWLSGDQIVEQHVHNIDVMNWAFNGLPATAVGMGGRAQRTQPVFGNVFDHFTTEFEYNGIRGTSMCRQMDNCNIRIHERIVGTKGVALIDGFGAQASIEGENPWKFEGKMPDPYIQEHADLIESIRSGKPINEAARVAESTLTGVMGRISAYTGRQMKYEWILEKSELNLFPEKLEFGPNPVQPVAVPGKTPLV
jgi:predicted dehydrogenase